MQVTTIVKPVYNNHSPGLQKLAYVGRWFLWTGSVHKCCIWRCPFLDTFYWLMWFYVYISHIIRIKYIEVTSSACITWWRQWTGWHGYQAKPIILTLTMPIKLYISMMVNQANSWQVMSRWEKCLTKSGLKSTIYFVLIIAFLVSSMYCFVSCSTQLPDEVCSILFCVSSVCFDHLM